MLIVSRDFQIAIEEEEDKYLACAATAQNDTIRVVQLTTVFNDRSSSSSHTTPAPKPIHSPTPSLSASRDTHQRSPDEWAPRRSRRGARLSHSSRPSTTTTSCQPVTLSSLRASRVPLPTIPSRKFLSGRRPKRPSRRLWRSDTPAERTDGSSPL